MTRYTRLGIVGLTALAALVVAALVWWFKDCGCPVPLATLLQQFGG